MRTGLQLNCEGHVYGPNGGTPVGAIDLGPNAGELWNSLRRTSEAWLRSQGAESLFLEGSFEVMSVDAVVASTPFIIPGRCSGLTRSQAEQYLGWVHQLEQL